MGLIWPSPQSPGLVLPENDIKTLGVIYQAYISVLGPVTTCITYLSPLEWLHVEVGPFNVVLVFPASLNLLLGGLKSLQTTASIEPRGP